MSAYPEGLTPVGGTGRQAQTQGTRRVGRLEPAALAGVMSRDVAIFGRYWKATTFSSVVQPTITERKCRL